MENYKEIREQLIQAIGLNKLDSDFAKAMLSLKLWDKSKAIAVQKMLGKYKGVPNEIKNNSVKSIYNILYPGQKEDLNKIEKFNGRSLLALPVGAGKTFISLAYAEQHPELRPNIIITPASVKLQWYEVIKEWMPDEHVKIIEGRSDYLDNNDNNIILINYDLMYWYWELLEDLNPKLVIADEAHRLRGKDSQRTKCTRKLARKVPHIIFMTGTPIYHRPMDVFPMLKMLGLNDSYYDFGCKYCTNDNDSNGQFKGANNLQELHNLLTRNFMVRRSEEEIKKDLPPVNPIAVPIQIDNRKEYDLAEEDLIQYLREYEGWNIKQLSGKAETLMKLNRLRLLAAEGKLSMLKDWMSDFAELGKKIVLFSYHHSIRDNLCEKFPDNSVRHDGKMTAGRKEKAKKEFMENKDITFFLGQIHASGEGVDGLQRVCHNLGFVEFDWGPKSHDQAIGRIQRNGIDKTIEKINCFWFIAYHTIEEKMAELIDSKRKNIDAAVDGIKTNESEMITELINYYMGRR